MNEDVNAIVHNRSCGTCSLCCKLPVVVELNKPLNTWCPHCRPGRGCGIYETRAPVCREFHCGYLTEVGLGEEWNPQRARMLLIMEHIENRVTVVVDPARPDAWRQPPYHQQIRQWAARAAPVGGKIHVCIGPRTVVVQPDRDVDLGELDADEVILTTRRQTALGIVEDVQKVRRDDPRLREIGVVEARARM